MTIKAALAMHQSSLDRTTPLSRIHIGRDLNRKIKAISPTDVQNQIRVLNHLCDLYTLLCIFVSTRPCVNSDKPLAQ